MSPLAHPADIGVHFLRSRRRLLHITGDFSGGRALLLNPRRNSRCGIADFTDDVGDALNSGDGFFGRGLNLIDLQPDLLGRLGGLIGKALDLARHHGKALPRIARSRRLDRRVQSQQIGLPCNAIDKLNDRADFLCAFRQFLHDIVGALRLYNGIAGRA